MTEKPRINPEGEIEISLEELLDDLQQEPQLQRAFTELERVNLLLKFNELQLQRFFRLCCVFLVCGLVNAGIAVHFFKFFWERPGKDNGLPILMSAGTTVLAAFLIGMFIANVQRYQQIKKERNNLSEKIDDLSSSEVLNLTQADDYSPQRLSEVLGQEKKNQQMEMLDQETINRRLRLKKELDIPDQEHLTEQNLDELLRHGGDSNP